MHHIQKYILRTLTYAKNARFRDMRPSGIDSNLYNYHLRLLCKQGFVEKYEQGYRLSPEGLSYVDRISVEKFEPRAQPKIITMLCVQDDQRILLWSKKKQPFITSWSLPNGKVHIDDESIEIAAKREAMEKMMDIAPASLRHRGVCSIRAYINKELVSYVLAHIFSASLETVDTLSDNTRWYSMAEMEHIKLAPATKQIVQKLAVTEEFFYEAYTVDW